METAEMNKNKKLRRKGRKHRAVKKPLKDRRHDVLEKHRKDGDEREADLGRGIRVARKVGRFVILPGDLVTFELDDYWFNGGPYRDLVGKVLLIVATDRLRAKLLGFPTDINVTYLTKVC